jgi:hypothetical protein
MMSKNEHPSAESPAVLEWREVARTSCVKIDWARVRTHLSSSGLHPDQGGDGVQATLLIAAKNLLVERARANRP